MTIKIMDGFKFQMGIDGSKKLIIESSRLEECIRYVKEGNIKEITINYFQGYEFSDINFLIELADVLEGLHLPETKFRYEVINRLRKLTRLGIADNGLDNIDLKNFPDLVSLACEYSPRLIGLENCTKLENLSLTKYNSKSKSLAELGEYSELKELHLFLPKIETLKGIERYGNLKILDIYSASKLLSLSALIRASSKMEEIEIEKCKKVTDFEILGAVHSLRRIRISESGEIKSLAFVTQLPKLEFISFWGANVLDGNLEYCSEIGYVGFDNKRHYSHKMKDFKHAD